MKTHSVASTDDDNPESDLEPAHSITDRTRALSPPTPNRQSSAARNRTPTNSSWKQSNGTRVTCSNGQALGDYDSIAWEASLSSSDTSRRIAMAPQPPSEGLLRPRRSLWSMSILCLLSASVGIALLLTISASLALRELDPKGCRMSYMRPSYIRFAEFDTEHTRFATKYSLYLYREQGIDDESRVCNPLSSLSAGA
jgi:glycosylphosphatidylinositol deacylase